MGLRFDYKLSFNFHISQIQTECSLALNIVKFLAGTWWGSHPDTLLCLYKSFIRSIIDYSSFIYFPKKKSNIDKLERIQYAAIRSALSFRKSTPTNILLSESKLPPIAERSQNLCQRYLVKMLSNSKSTVFESIIRYYTNCQNKKRKKSLLRKTISQIFPLKKEIEIDRKYNPFWFDYENLITEIPVDFKFGLQLRNSNLPNILLRDKITLSLKFWYIFS